MNRWYSLALRLCAESTHTTRMACVIVKGGRVLALATNRAEQHQHAEARALRQKGDFTGATVYVAREGRRMSRPCELCCAGLKAAGVIRAVYADWTGQLTTEVYK